jgi:uncharacterized membrane protein YdjX (TVP38/TMEM64 family)
MADAMNSLDHDKEAVRKVNRHYRWRFFLILIAGLILLAEAFGLSGWLLFFQNLIRHDEKIGYLVFVVLYAVTSLAMIPGTGMTVLAGLLFPPFIAVALSSIGALAAAILAFWIARKFARGRVERWLAGSEKYEKYSSIIKAHEVRVLIVLRLIPISPHVTMNYIFGLTRISFVAYVFWTWLCLLPGTIVYVLLANNISSALFSGHIFYGLLLSAILLAVLVYFAW